MALTVSKEFQARAWAARDRDTAFFMLKADRKKRFCVVSETKLKRRAGKVTEFAKLLEDGEDGESFS